VWLKSLKEPNVIGEPKSVDATRVSARRRLLRGAFAVPAMMTVASGSALANTSTTSLARAVNIGLDFKPELTDSYDPTCQQGGLIRVPLWVLKNSGTVKSYWVQGSDMATYDRTGVSMLGSGYHLFNYSTGVLEGTVQDSPPSQSGFTYQLANKYVALQFDVEGHLLGASTASSVQGISSAVHCSVWSSFAVV
jgi:hypothetical protein